MSSAGHEQRTGPEHRAGLEEQRGFLLRSLRDLDAERAAGDLSDADYRSLRDDYTVRAASVLRDLQGDASGRGGAGPDQLSTAQFGAWAPHPAGGTTGRKPSRWRPATVAAAVVVGAGLAGWVVATSAGERTATDASSGSIVEGSTDRIARAQALQRTDILGAVKVYDDLLVDDPENPVALAERGWLISRVDPSLADSGLATIDRAIALDPGYPDAHFFRGMILFRLKGQPAAAAEEFERALAAKPPPDVAAQIDGVYRLALAAAAAAPTAPSTTPPSTTP